MFAAKVVAAGDQVTGLRVKLPVPVATVCGISPVTGAVTCIAAVVMVVRPAAVCGNWNDKVTALPVLFVTVAALPFIVAVVNPLKVNPVFAVRVTVAVYLVFAANTV